MNKYELEKKRVLSNRDDMLYYSPLPNYVPKNI